ncbi:MAG: UDP-N-acetylglucosamine 2-epimerase (non-hydrolyzing) [Candidatus Aenigmarchaeota archaeon]|nr:UDP-N-acetylglucosamine 2-epimerase (non-hydrolyzing) [Candidatus Aenigmarchaeota archaeon]
MGKLKVMSILGTRPEIIRLSETIKKLEKYTNHVLVHTNQNYNYELNDIFFKELNLKKPDYLLDVKSKSIGEQIGRIISQTEKIILKEKPDSILILGDTNSALSCIIAKRLKIPIFHMEAGNRCFDDRVPEEINRKIVDHTSDVNLPYTEHARRNLLKEGLKSEYIFVTGSPMAEIIMANQSKINQSNILKKLNIEENKYFVVSIHREENLDNEENLLNILKALEKIAKKYKYPLIISTHPRLKKKLNKNKIKLNKLIKLNNPFGMFDYIKLQKNAYCNLSDSGTIHEDAAIMELPALVIRESNEKQEVYDTGNVIMTGIDSEIILNSIEIVVDQKKRGVKFLCPENYRDTNVSEKVVRLIIGLSKLIKKKIYYL